ncbi:bestrophin-like domain [Pseudomonas citronellolis]|uniref:bestrophin-like domain n=1 Tax=Pseudomonas citronellolis TaxID=53408 RepID=UPI002D77FFCB|nr:hypothetical protein [Pseudomonas citronellolis]WRT82508.1 hypothetical protein VK748_29435 [Pseudomonas citronellolis]
MTTLNSIGIFLASFLGLWLGAQLGVWLCRRSKTPSEGVEDFRMILGAALSLLGLLIGFTLSMSISGFNGRQTGEEMEAATINAAYIRADLLPAEDSARIRTLLVGYLETRLQFYTAKDSRTQESIRLETIALQNQLWSAISTVANARQTPVIALAVTGINDVLNAQKKSYANWRNQIPLAAWLLLGVVALCCNLMLGYNARNLRRRAGLLMILPMMIGMSFMMIADIDVPGRGIIRVKPVNLEYLYGTIKSQQAITAPTATAPGQGALQTCPPAGRTDLICQANSTGSGEVPSGHITVM